MAQILVTGGAGFVGSHLVDELVAMNHNVTVLDDFSTGALSNLGDHAASDVVDIVDDSILNEDGVDELVAASDNVIHCAASVGVFRILDDPISSMRVNVRGSEIVLDACHRHEIPVTLLSSSEVYGKNYSDSIDEESDRLIGAPMKLRWAYSEAKALDESMAFAYHEKYGLPVVVVRLFNTVGPRQSAAYGMVIPRLVEQALQGVDLTVFGSGRQKRCFLHVRDACQAITQVFAREDAVGLAFNIGNPDEVTILELAALVLRLTGSESKVKLIPYDEAYPHGFEDMERRRPSIERISALTGWSPEVPLESLIRDVIADKEAKL